MKNLRRRILHSNRALQSIGLMVQKTWPDSKGTALQKLRKVLHWAKRLESANDLQKKIEVSFAERMASKFWGILHQDS